MKYIVREVMYRRKTVFEVRLSFEDSGAERVLMRYGMEESAQETADLLNDLLDDEVE